MRFEARDLNEQDEPVTPESLREGDAYYSVQFDDDEMTVPVIETFVYVGRNLDPDMDEDMASDGVGGDHFYFQDVNSYGNGKPWDADDDDVVLYVQPLDQLAHIFEFEPALEVLMKCSLRRNDAAK